MKRSLLIAGLAVAAACWMVPCEAQACGRFGHRLRAVVRAPLRVARAPVRLVRTIRQRRCGCGPSCYCSPACYCAPAATPVGATDCAKPEPVRRSDLNV